MTWTYYNDVIAEFATYGGATYNKYRTFAQTVQARFRVINMGAYQPSYFSATLDLLDSSGGIWGTGRLVKYAGSVGAWTTLVGGLPGKSLRLRIRSTYDEPANANGIWVAATMDLRYGLA